MIQRMLASALFAGFAAGLFAALLHFVFVQDFILMGERYESGAATHFGGPAPHPADPAAAPHDHADATAAHDHDHGTPASDLTRNGLTVAFAALLYVGYGLLLVAGFAVAETMGRRVTAREGILWGIAGFAALQLAPAMGLSPVLPGTLTADLTLRQVWWLGTAIATAAGLALLAYGRGPVAIAAAGVLIALPHLIGAPELATFSGTAPPEVAAAFAARTLGCGLAVWALLGWLAGRFWTAQAA